LKNGWSDDKHSIPQYHSITSQSDGEQMITWTIAQLDRQTSDSLVITAHYTVNGVDAIEANLAAQIEAKKNPTTAVGVPW